MFKSEFQSEIDRIAANNDANNITEISNADILTLLVGIRKVEYTYLWLLAIYYQVYSAVLQKC